MNVKSDKIKKIFKKKFFLKFSLALAKHPVFSCVILLSIAVILSLLVYYQYVASSQKVEFEMFSKRSIFKEALYQKIIQIQQDQDMKFQEADKKQYKNPFLTASQD